MILKGEKVILRAIEREDQEFLKEMINDPELEKLVVGWSFPVSLEMQMQWYEKQKNDLRNLRYIIEADGERIGLATIKNIDWKNRTASHGIKLANINMRGKGYGKDTVFTIMKYAFEELQLNRLYGSILEYNEPSRRLYEKCGWSIEGIARQSVFKDNQYHNEIMVSILKDDYLKKKEFA